MSTRKKTHLLENSVLLTLSSLPEIVEEWHRKETCVLHYCCTIMAQKVTELSQQWLGRQWIWWSFWLHKENWRCQHEDIVQWWLLLRGSITHPLYKIANVFYMPFHCNIFVIFISADKGSVLVYFTHFFYKQQFYMQHWAVNLADAKQ